MTVDEDREKQARRWAIDAAEGGLKSELIADRLEELFGVDRKTAVSYARYGVKQATEPMGTDRPTESLLMYAGIGEAYLNLVGLRYEVPDQLSPSGVRGLNKGDIARLREVARQLKIRTDQAEDLLTIHLYENQRHPVREALTAAEIRYRGDPGEYIERLAAHFESDLFSRWLPLWLAGSARRAWSGEQNPTLVMAGPQGVGKSFFVRWLATPMAAFHIESPIDPHNKDFEIRLLDTFIWEVAELDATTKRSEMAALKHFLGRESVDVRLPYDRDKTKGPALANFIATVNPEGDGGILRDVTGYRRFLPCTIESIDHRYSVDLDPELIWGQAVAAWRDRPEVATLSAEDRTVRDDAVRDRYEQSDPIEDAVHTVLRAGEGRMANTSIYTLVLGEGAASPADAAAVRRALSRMGGRPYRTNRERGWDGIKKR